jgi:hypothetical protein
MSLCDIAEADYEKRLLKARQQSNGDDTPAMQAYEAERCSRWRVAAEWEIRAEMERRLMRRGLL